MKGIIVGFKKKILSMLMVALLPVMHLNAVEEKDYNITEVQLHAVMGIITNFILSSIADTTPPVFTSSNNITVAENQMEAITLVATDVSVITYSINGGESSSFEINATTGVVIFKEAPDFETLDSYTFIAKATDAYGNETMQEVTIDIDDVEESIVHNGTTYDIVTSPHTGKVWLDRNLGANRVCTSFNDTQCYGDYYQWGRDADGHEDFSSLTTNIQATDINNAGIKFIKGNDDWAAVDLGGSIRQFNWSRTDGISICPIGFRVPTIDELKVDTIEATTTNGSTKVINTDTAFSNFLKLPAAGYRGGWAGMMHYVGIGSHLWSVSKDNIYASDLNFGTNYAYLGAYDGRADAHLIRCIED